MLHGAPPRLAPASIPVDPVVRLSAGELASAIRRKAISCVETMTAYLDHVERVNGAVNAIVALRDPAALLAEAAEKDAELARGEYRGWLHGIPQAPKDLAMTKGLVTTFGSPIFRAMVPQTDSLVVARMRAAGAIFIGKTNTPEFGLGSHTFNEVYGVTRNPYDLAKSAGGSSGGAAAALAARLLPVADGSDFGGSLRNPAAFCNVYGMRPSAGRVPRWPRADVFVQQLGTLRGIGCDVDAARPAFSPQRIWRIWLAHRHGLAGGGLLTHYRHPERRALLKPEAVFEIEGLLEMSGRAAARGSRRVAARARLRAGARLGRHAAARMDGGVTRDSREAGTNVVGRGCFVYRTARNA